MSTIDVRLPDGTVIQGVPENITRAELVQKLQRNGMSVPADWLPKEPAAPASRNNNAGAQAGLAGRAMVKGALAVPGMFNDAFGGVANTVLDQIPFMRGGFRFGSTQGALDDLMTRAGVPEPQTADERIVSKAVEMGTGAGAAARGAQAASGLLGYVGSKVAERLASNAATQVGAGVGSGLAGQQAQESGAGFGTQLAASLVGGVLGGGATQAAQGAAGAVRSMLPGAVKPADLEARISTVLQSRGFDPSALSPAMRKSLMDDAKAAMKKGQLNEDALARLADYKLLGLTPTRGRLTLDPYDVTQEQNAQRMAAALGNRDAKLPEIAQANNRGLLGQVERFAPAADREMAGESVMAPILARDAAKAAAKEAAYRGAKDMAGGDIPLGRGVVQNVFERLISENRLRYVPPEIQQQLNDISKGFMKVDGRRVEVPWNVNVIDNLKTDLAAAQRSAQGPAKRALGIIREVLDSDAVQPDKRVFGGAQMVTPGQAQAMQAADDAPAGLLGALNDARAKNRDWMQWRESSPGIQAAVDGANAETFVQKFILSRSADPKDVSVLAREITSSAPAKEAARSAIVQHLQDAAIGKGNNPQTGNFSGRMWSSALSDIDNSKLRLFFDGEEMERLRAIGRVGSVETFQPRGSAVNNSNTAAGVAGVIQGLSKYLKPVANKLPLGQEIVSAPLDNITLSLMQRGATRIPQALVTRQQQGLLADPYVLPAMTGLGLLAAP